MLLELVPNHHNGRAASSARTRKEAGTHGTRPERSPIWSFDVPADGTRAAALSERRLR